MREKEVLKSIPVLDQPITNKNTELAAATLKIAEQNLQASIILYDNRLYPEAIYFLQQSIEKTCKSFSYKLGIITENESTQIGHNPSKVYLRIAKQYTGLLKHTKKSFTHLIDDNKPEMVNKFIQAMIDEIGNLEDKSKKLEEKFESFSKNKENYSYIDETELEGLLEKCDGLFYDANKEKENIYVQFDSMVEIFSRNPTGIGVDPDDKQIIDETTRNMQGKQQLSILISIDALAPLLMLAIITQPHENATRYVINNNNPLCVYNETHPLVTHCKKMQSLMTKIIVILNDRYIEIDNLDN